MAKNNILINCGKLREDVDNVNRSLKLKDGLTLSKRLDKAHIGSAAFANSLTAFDKNKDIDVTLYEDCDKRGLMSELRLFAICNLFGLNGDEYILKLKKNKTTNKDGCSFRDIRNGMSQTEKDIMNINVKVGAILNALCKFSGKFEGECLLQTNKKVEALGKAIEKLGRIEAQNMEYLKEIKDGIEKLNEKWN